MLQERDEEEEVRDDATFAQEFSVRRVLGSFLGISPPEIS